MLIENISKIKQVLKNTNILDNHLKEFSIDAQDKTTGNTLLHQAVFDKVSPYTIESLIVKGANPYIKNKNNQRVIELKTFQDYINHIIQNRKPDPSKKIYSIYLAGPEVFLTFSLTAGTFIKAQTLLFNIHYLKEAPYNIKGIYPFDSGYTPKNLDFHDGIEIYKGDVGIMDRSQAVLANMVKFRGPGMDGGTAFEMGYMSAQGKIIIGYYDERPFFDKPKKNRPYTQKVIEEIGALKKKKNLTYDKKYLLVEPFEMPDNLMMVVPTLSENGKLNIAGSSWEALFLLKEKLDKLEIY